MSAVVGSVLGDLAVVVGVVAAEVFAGEFVAAVHGDGFEEL